MQRFGPIAAFALLVFGVGFMLGVQLSPLNKTIALGFGSGTVLPVVVAYLAAARQGKGTGAI